MTLLLVTNGCAGKTPPPRESVALAFPTGGRAGAAGVESIAAARLALSGAGVRVVVFNLDPGLQNPHEDTGTDDERAARAVPAALRLLERDGTIRAIVVGPTRAIARAAETSPSRIPIVASAPLVRTMPCACPSEAALAARAALIEDVDGRSWYAAAKRYADIRAALLAAPHGGSLLLVNRAGDLFEVPRSAVPFLRANPDALDAQAVDLSARGIGLRDDAPAVSPAFQRQYRALAFAMPSIAARRAAFAAALALRRGEFHFGP